MSNANFDANFVCESLKVFFEKIMSGTIAAATVARNEKRCCVWIIVSPEVVPPVTNTITSKFTSIMTDANIDIANILGDIIETMWNNNSFGKTRKVMIVGFQFFQSIKMPISIEIA